MIPPDRRLKSYRYTLKDRAADFFVDHQEGFIGGLALAGVAAIGAGLGVGIGHFAFGDGGNHLWFDAGYGAGAAEMVTIVSVWTAAGLGAFK